MPGTFKNGVENPMLFFHRFFSSEAPFWLLFGAPESLRAPQILPFGGENIVLDRTVSAKNTRPMSFCFFEGLLGLRELLLDAFSMLLRSSRRPPGFPRLLTHSAPCPHRAPSSALHSFLHRQGACVFERARLVSGQKEVKNPMLLFLCFFSRISC